ncbi:MAG TPA: MazG-like family protein [Phycisphaerae bacterium]|nr:MazG-like family protein [Phycisphaerae bacterium]
MSLTFDALRKANVERLPLFKNSKNQPAHSAADGSDWPLDAWSNALAGEVGEAANIIKKMRRGDLDQVSDRELLADELADVAIYLDLLAYRAGIDLGAAVRDKFNRKSVQVGCAVKL